MRTLSILRHGKTIIINGRQYNPTLSSQYRAIKLFLCVDRKDWTARKKVPFRISSTTGLQLPDKPQENEVDFRNFCKQIGVTD